MQLDTHPCDTCGHVPRLWGYNECEACFAEMQEAQRKALPKLKLCFVWCDLCQTEVTDCLHRKQARKDGTRLH
jgi:hypothetical protein